MTLLRFFIILPLFVINNVQIIENNIQIYAKS